MYLAKKIVGSRTRYYIRQSRREGRHYVSRDLLDLGTDPAQYVVYPGGNAFYKDVLQTMSRRSLARLYRRKAQALHPDKGGNHEAFIRLTEGYRELVRRKK
jgi:hypothetical protein